MEKKLYRLLLRMLVYSIFLSMIAASAMFIFSGRDYPRYGYGLLFVMCGVGAHFMVESFTLTSREQRIIRRKYKDPVMSRSTVIAQIVKSLVIAIALGCVIYEAPSFIPRDAMLIVYWGFGLAWAYFVIYMFATYVVNRGWYFKKVLSALIKHVFR